MPCLILDLHYQHRIATKTSLCVNPKCTVTLMLEIRFWNKKVNYAKGVF